VILGLGQKNIVWGLTTSINGEMFKLVR